MYQQLIDEFVRQESLPAAYRQDAQTWFAPLLAELKTQIADSETSPFVIGISGAQGTGKSTLAKLLCYMLQQDGYAVAQLSIDDFYLSRARRKQLADQVHPLLVSRGVPGTHDTALALSIFAQLRAAREHDRVILPAFDKASDDCLPVERCPGIEGALDVIILEGWFVGVEPQPDAELSAALNELEASRDEDARWRRYVNQQLGLEYQELFAQLDLLIMLQAPAFEQVSAWRKLQEDKLRRSNPGASGLMSDAQIDEFIQHFERLTRHSLATLPGYADIVFRLDAQHRIASRRD